jgi:hypothetical protein
VVALLLAVSDLGGETFRLACQGLLVGAGEEQVRVLVRDTVLGRDAQPERFGSCRVAFLLSFGGPVGCPLELGLLCRLDLVQT